MVSQHGYLTFDLSIAQKRCSTWLWTADIHILKYTNLTGVLGQDVICWTFRHKCCRRPRQNFSLRVPLIINYIALIPSQYKMYLVCYALHYRRKRACRTVQLTVWLFPFRRDRTNINQLWRSGLTNSMLDRQIGPQDHDLSRNFTQS